MKKVVSIPKRAILSPYQGEIEREWNFWVKMKLLSK
jgi:hypothetical protein